MAKKKAVHQRDALAQFNLGNCYYYGWGVIRIERDAYFLWQDAALQGYPLAEYIVGSCHLKGFAETTIDYVQAISWLSSAAKHGNQKAQNFINRIRIITPGERLLIKVSTLDLAGLSIFKNLKPPPTLSTKEFILMVVANMGLDSIEKPRWSIDSYDFGRLGVAVQGIPIQNSSNDSVTPTGPYLIDYTINQDDISECDRVLTVNVDGVKKTIQYIYSMHISIDYKKITSDKQRIKEIEQDPVYLETYVFEETQRLTIRFRPLATRTNKEYWFSMIPKLFGNYFFR